MQTTRLHTTQKHELCRSKKQGQACACLEIYTRYMNSVDHVVGDRKMGEEKSGKHGKNTKSYSSDTDDSSARPFCIRKVRVAFVLLHNKMVAILYLQQMVLLARMVVIFCLREWWYEYASRHADVKPSCTRHFRRLVAIYGGPF